MTGGGIRRPANADACVHRRSENEIGGESGKEVFVKMKKEFVCEVDRVGGRSAGRGGSGLHPETGPA